MHSPTQQRRSIRLQGYDYAQSGAYYITICAHQRARWFGRVIEGQMVLNELGQIVEATWLTIPVLRPYIDLDAFVVMPDHFHAIVVISRRSEHAPPYEEGIFRSPSQTLGALVRGFKGAVTKQIAAIWDDPQARVWQRNYYDHIIRSADELQRIRQYIADNPGRWPG